MIDKCSGDQKEKSKAFSRLSNCRLLNKIGKPGEEKKNCEIKLIHPHSELEVYEMSIRHMDRIGLGNYMFTDGN